jgi:hypothetical protein
MFWGEDLPSYRGVDMEPDAWHCPRCAFFYRPIEHRGIPKKYQDGFKAIKRMCMTGRGENEGQAMKCLRQVNGRAKYCPRCTAKRHNSARRAAKAGHDLSELAGFSH